MANSGQVEVMFLVVLPYGRQFTNDLLSLLKEYNKCPLKHEDTELQLADITIFYWRYCLYSSLRLALFNLRYKPHVVIVDAPTGNKLSANVKRVFQILNNNTPSFEFRGNHFIALPTGRRSWAWQLLGLWFGLIAALAMLGNACGGLLGALVALAIYILLDAALARTLFNRKSAHSSSNRNNIGEYQLPIKLYNDGHPLLGWTHSSCVDIVRGFTGNGENSDYRYRIRTDAQGHRITHELPKKKDTEANTAAIVGCSYTFGASLNDWQTYPWQLQEILPDWDIINLGCCGYSLYQMFIALKQALRLHKLDVVILGLHSRLEHRIRWSREEAKEMFALGRKYPSCKVSGNKLKHFPPQGYQSVPFTHLSALLSGVEYIYNELRFCRLGNDSTIHNTNRWLLNEMRRICNDNGIEFIVACLDQCPDYYDYLYSRNFSWIASEISLDRIDPSPWTLFPIDSHPNQEAHKLWAVKIAEVIPQVTNHTKVSPRIQDLQSWVLRQNSDYRSPDKSDIYPIY